MTRRSFSFVGGGWNCTFAITAITLLYLTFLLLFGRSLLDAMGQVLSCPPLVPGHSRSKTGKDVTESCSDLSRPQTPLEGPPVLKKAKGHYWYPSNSSRILDACGGAGVACLGHGRHDIIKAVNSQMKSATYASYAHFQTTPVQELSDWLIKSTDGEMQKVYIMSSGTLSPRLVY